MLRTLLLCFACAVTAHSQIRILALSPTALFPNRKPLRQVAMLQVLNESGAPLRCRFTASMESGESTQQDTVVPAGASSQRILVPDIERPSKLLVEIRAEGGGSLLASRNESWQPQRKWKVFIVKSSHEDLGYEDFIFRKQHENAEWVDIARRLSNPKVPMGGGNFHFTLESMLLMRNYIDERSEADWRNLADTQIKTGQMDIMGAPSGVHSHWMDYEELARMTYPARREARDRYGLDLRTFMIVDNPSLSWSGAQAVAEAGFSYVARWGQGWRTGGNNDYQHTRLPALFWWQAPDGIHKVLFSWRSHYGLIFWYGQPSGGYGDVFDLAGEQVSGEMKRIEDGSLLGPYPYDAVIYPSYVDHAIPHVDERTLPAWTKAYAYPEIRIATPTAFFEYIEGKYGTQLPTLSGDLNNFSADYATIDPESQGWKREASRSLPFAEGLSAIASYLTESFQPVTARVARLWTDMFDYDEHSWPTQPRASDDHLFNANWVKKQGAQRVLTGTNQLLDQAVRAVTEQVPVSSSGTVIVLNSLAHSRDGLVTVQGNFAALKDLSTGQIVPCQKSGENASIFVARGVPAYGYKVYAKAEVEAAGLKQLVATEDHIENQFYSVHFDRHTGNVVGITDKKTGRELVDAKAKYQFNGMVYVHKDQRESKEGFEYVPTAAQRSDAHAGPVRAEFTAWIDDPKTGAAIRQTLTLYDGLPRIDIVNDIRHARIMYSDNYEDRYRDNIFYAFPVNVPGGQPRVEYAGGVVRPYDDQLRWGSHDYLVANRWVDVSTPQFGVTVAPWNESTFDFGEIRYNRFSIDYKPTSPYLFSFAWSNRMAGLLTLNPDECNATLGYSIRAHDGDWNSGATTDFGWSIGSPLIATVVAPHAGGKLDPKQSSFLSVDASNVQLTVLKQSEQAGHGWIARFVETEGKPATFRVDSRLLPIAKAYLSDLVENDKSPLTVSGNAVQVSIPAYGHATVRFESGVIPGKIVGLSGSSPSGRRANLTWAPVTDPSFYSVYRSADPKDPPTSYTLVGRTHRPTFADSGLDPGSTYYYRVAAVTRENLQGEVSGPVTVRTLDANTEPPAPATGLSVVRLSKNRLMIVWHKNGERDVARYRLYRGERAGFTPDAASLIYTAQPGGYFLETHIDEGLKPGHTYFYRVEAEDWAAHRQKESPVVSAITPAN
jgi:alpha-mannosidase